MVSHPDTHQQLFCLDLPFLYALIICISAVFAAHAASYAACLYLQESIPHGLPNYSWLHVKLFLMPKMIRDLLHRFSNLPLLRRTAIRLIARGGFLPTAACFSN